jgi:hypothetical protein
VLPTFAPRTFAPPSRSGLWLAPVGRAGRVVPSYQIVILRESGTPNEREQDAKMQILSGIDNSTNEPRPASADDLRAATAVPILEPEIGR